MATTLTDLRSQLLDELKIDPNQKINSTLLLNRNINRALRKVEQSVGYALPENVTSAVISTTSGTNESNLPSDFKRIANPHGVKVGGSTPLFPVDYVALLGFTDVAVNSGQPTQYYIRKSSSSQWVIGFNPTPASTYAVTIPYYKKLTEMTDDSDESPLEEEYDEPIVQYAAYLTMRRIKGFEQKAADYRASYREAIADVVGNSMMANQYDNKVSGQRRERGYYWNPRGLGGNY